MAKINEQLTLGDIDEEYQKFVDKFKPKKTTDDCYTPANIYEAVLGWVVEEYGIDPNKVVRPFWPGGGLRKVRLPGRLHGRRQSAVFHSVAHM